jgi:lactate dehydrogenase-like 2-hydroxyacid dehydrogenase
MAERPAADFTRRPPTTIAFNSHEAVRRILDTTAENIAAFVSGAPRNLVDLA